MALSVLGMFLGLLLEVSTHGPSSVPRSSWRHDDVDLLEFWEPDVFNYTTLLLSEERGVLYVGAREAVYQLNMSNVSIKSNQLLWKVPERDMSMCILKGKSKETDCRNYIRVLQVLDEDTLYVCGTHAFQPLCDYLSLQGFRLQDRAEDGRGKCSFDPAQSFTSVMVDGELYSGTAYNFLGSEPIISRSSLSQSLLRTEYSTSWLNEPSFVFTDVIREGQNSPDGDDDKIYYFFTEVSVEYEFFGKLLIPRIARVCKFMTVGLGNVGLSAVCAYNMSSVHEVFSKGKYMQKVTVEQSHTKWVRFNGITPSPRPGECINNLNRMQNITSSLQLPDKTLQFVKDHPLLEDPVLPIGNGPRLVTKDVNYTQIAVQRVQALDGSIHHVIFTGTDKGLLHKSLVLEGEVHIVEEIQLLKNTEPIKTLLLSSQVARFLYAGSDSGVVQSPTAFCEKYPSCVDCVLARDPYCAWDPRSGSCLNIFQHDADPRKLIQSLKGDAGTCPTVAPLAVGDYQQVLVKPGGSADLSCPVRSNLAQVLWKLNGHVLTEASRFLLLSENGLLIYSVTPEDAGRYECWSVEASMGQNFTRLVVGYALQLELPESAPSVSALRPSSATSTLPPEEGNTSNGSGLTPTHTDAPSLTTPPSNAIKPKHYIPPEVSNLPTRTETLDPSAKYIQHDNSVALLSLFLLFFLLFLAALAYNCYMQYLPAPCLRLRSALLGSNKKPQPEYAACEAGLMETVQEKMDPANQNGAHPLRTLRDTGYETEPECGNGGVPSGNDDSPSKEQPFDVDCASQPIEYADADADAPY
ncbi:hypothetical protein cypCar_00016825 [Cyprinus carpio]|nr:hypothetical protein cypCar_00016825 [Cyprinus carpio]